ncbi:MAG: poly-gamma-glutamate biosynthesis protein PgsC [Planctomycetaceae bacterium]
MHVELVTLSIGIGLIVGIVLAELYGLSAGGMVVPGYLALFLHQPLVVVATLLAALATLAVVKLLSRQVIIYGKRRVAVMMLTGFLIGTTAGLLFDWFAGPESGGLGSGRADLAIVGYIIPGLIAIWFDRQGFFETVCTVLTASGIVRLTLFLIDAEVIV